MLRHGQRAGLSCPLNRTILELKFFTKYVASASECTLNRTILELKYCDFEPVRSDVVTLNRTILELKLPRSCLIRLFLKPLIAPSWN